MAINCWTFGRKVTGRILYYCIFSLMSHHIHLLNRSDTKNEQQNFTLNSYILHSFLSLCVEKNGISVVPSFCIWLPID